MRNLSRETIVEIKRGDRKAFKKLYDTYASFVYNVSFKILRETSLAEEVVQECFVNLWVKREGIDESKELSFFIFVMAKRICLNYLRKIRYTNKFLDQVKIFDVNDVQQKIDYNELENVFVKYVTLLPKQQRIAFELSRLEGLTHQQIAEEMGISPNTVKNHITQALAYLRKQLIASNYEIPLIIIFFLLD